MKKIFNKLVGFFKKLARPKGKTAFLSQVTKGKVLLDVGCGNNSPYFAKSVSPDCYYIGLDVGDTNQTLPNLADEYVISSPENFSTAIHRYKNKVDFLISSHNLEHCNDRFQVLNEMLSALRLNGMIYLSFPSEASQFFPLRDGPLNYYQEATHIAEPPDFLWIKNELLSRGFEIIFSEKNYKPWLTRTFGALVEPLSAFRKRTMVGTWDYYGFETVIWAKRTC